MQFETPIALMIFNRPDLTRRVFDAIAARKPRRLLVIGDGPRNHVVGEAERVAETRRIIEQIDWPCYLTVNYSKQNLGCKNRMASGLTWAFEQCEELIVLEDDCLPHRDFFDFCQQLLHRYRDDQRIMMISGDNFQPQRRTEFSYYFSRWAHIWGWASWKRAWQHYDADVLSWPKVKDQKLLASMCDNDREYNYWQELFDRQYSGKIDSWDYAWMYACWLNHGLTVLPEKNLVTNIGFRDDATHTTQQDSVLANLASSPIGNLKHPANVCRHFEADRWTFENIFAGSSDQSTAENLKRGKLRANWISRGLSIFDRLRRKHDASRITSRKSA